MDGHSPVTAQQVSKSTDKTQSSKARTLSAIMAPITQRLAGQHSEASTQTEFQPNEARVQAATMAPTTESLTAWFPSTQRAQEAHESDPSPPSTRPRAPRTSFSSSSSQSSSSTYSTAPEYRLEGEQPPQPRDVAHSSSPTYCPALQEQPQREPPRSQFKPLDVTTSTISRRNLSATGTDERVVECATTSPGDTEATEGDVRATLASPQAPEIDPEPQAGSEPEAESASFLSATTFEGTSRGKVVASSSKWKAVEDLLRSRQLEEEQDKAAREARKKERISSQVRTFGSFLKDIVDENEELEKKAKGNRERR